MARPQPRRGDPEGTPLEGRDASTRGTLWVAALRSRLEPVAFFVDTGLDVVSSRLAFIDGGGTLYRTGDGGQVWRVVR